jgi:guanine deaminase
MNLGLKVGLGTDVAGGISPSMLTAIRMAVVNSRCLRAHKLALKVSQISACFQLLVLVPSNLIAQVVVLLSKVVSCIHSSHSLQGGLEITPDLEVDVISYKEGLYLATLGGACALGIDVSTCDPFWANLAACGLRI